MILGSCELHKPAESEKYIVELIKKDNTTWCMHRSSFLHASCRTTKKNFPITSSSMPTTEIRFTVPQQSFDYINSLKLQSVVFGTSSNEHIRSFVESIRIKSR